jgi:hypothetical protein
VIPYSAVATHLRGAARDLSKAPTLFQPCGVSVAEQLYSCRCSADEVNIAACRGLFNPPPQHFKANKGSGTELFEVAPGAHIMARMVPCCVHQYTANS